MCDVYTCGSDGVIVRPKRVHKQEIRILPMDFACPRGPRGRQAREQRSEPGVILAHSGVTLRALGVYESYFGIIWINESYFGVILIRFQKTFVSPIDFKDFIQTAG